MFTFENQAKYYGKKHRIFKTIYHKIFMKF